MLTNDAFALQQRACFSFAVLTEIYKEATQRG